MNAMFQNWVCALLLASVSARAVVWNNPSCFYSQVNLFGPQPLNERSSSLQFVNPVMQVPVRPLLPTAVSRPQLPTANEHLASLNRPWVLRPSSPVVGPRTTRPLDSTERPTNESLRTHPKAKDVSDPILVPTNNDVLASFRNYDADHGQAMNEFIRRQVITVYPHMLSQEPVGDRKILGAKLSAGFREFIINEYAARLGLDPAKVSGDRLNLIDVTNNFGFGIETTMAIAGTAALPAYMAGALVSYGFDPGFYGLKSLHRVDHAKELLTREGAAKYAKNYLALANAQNLKTVAREVGRKMWPESQIAMVGMLTAFSAAKLYNWFAERNNNLPSLHRVSANRNPLQPELEDPDWRIISEQLAIAWVSRVGGENLNRFTKTFWMREYRGLSTKARLGKGFELSWQSIPADAKIASVVVLTMAALAKALKEIQVRDIKSVADFFKHEDEIMADVDIANDPSLDKNLKQWVQEHKAVESVLQGSARMLATFMVVTAFRNQFIGRLPWGKAVEQLKNIPLLERVPWQKIADGYKKTENLYNPTLPENGASNVANHVARWSVFAGMYSFTWNYAESFLMWLGAFDKPSEWLREGVEQYNQSALSNRLGDLPVSGRRPWGGAFSGSPPEGAAAGQNSNEARESLSK